MEENEKKHLIEQTQLTYNFDSPEAIDFDLVIKCLKQLQQYKPFDCPIYNKEHLQWEM